MRGKGFTLIELMIVVAIIGVLAAIAIPQFAALIRKSQEGSGKGNLGALRSSLEIYYGDMEGNYPNDISSLTVNGKYLGVVPNARTPGYHPDSSAEHHGTVGEFDDAGDWQYNNIVTASNYGMVWVNCTHTDTKGTTWSAY